MSSARCPSVSESSATKARRQSCSIEFVAKKRLLGFGIFDGDVSIKHQVVGLGFDGIGDEMFGFSYHYCSYCRVKVGSIVKVEV